MDGAKEAIDLGVVQYARPGGYLPLVNAIAKVRGQLLSDPLSLSLALSLRCRRRVWAFYSLAKREKGNVKISNISLKPSLAASLSLLLSLSPALFSIVWS